MARPIFLSIVGSVCFGLFAGPLHAQKGSKPPPSAASVTKPTSPTSPLSPPSTSYAIRRGDTLFRIAGKTRPPGVTLHQMVLALYRANPDAFLGGNINQLIIGRILAIPKSEKIVSVDPVQAGREVRALVAKPLAPVPPPAPAVKQAPPAQPPADNQPVPKPAAKAPALTPGLAEERLHQAEALERQGDLAGAMKAYLEAGHAGNGPAQKRLGDIYNTGNAMVRRDYETALKWYQKARAQGIEIPKPLVPGIRH